MSGSSSAVLSSATSDGIIAAFSRHAAKRPSDTVVVSPSDRVTFGDLDVLAHAVAQQIVDALVEPDGLMGLAAPNGPAFLAGFLALRRARQAVLLLDPFAPDEDRRRVIRSMGAGGVLECSAAWPSSPSEFHLTRSAPKRDAPLVPGTAVVKLTSGSTGTPRGVCVRTEQLLADEDALARTMGFREDDRLWCAVPLSHSYGFTTLALSTLVRGLMLAVPPDRDPFAALAAARQVGATVFPTVPAYIQALLKLSAPPRLPATVRLVISAGAVLTGSIAEAFRLEHGRSVHTFYGSSECGGICYDREGGAAERGTVGSPVEGVRLSLGPLESAPGEGLVVVESPAVGEAYFPVSESRLGAGRFESNDVGVWQSGELVLRRRIDTVINVRGRKVDPHEVELVLSALDGVAEAVVIGLTSSDGKDEIVCAVVACPSARLKSRDMVAWCRPRLADHKVPRRFLFVDSIPRTSRGKIDRSALLALESRLDSASHHG